MNERKAPLLARGSFVQSTQLGRLSVSWMESLLTLSARRPCDTSSWKSLPYPWGEPMDIPFLGLLQQIITDWVA